MDYQVRDLSASGPRPPKAQAQQEPADYARAPLPQPPTNDLRHLPEQLAHTLDLIIHKLGIQKIP